jgi:hypothetical protein
MLYSIRCSSEVAGEKKRNEQRQREREAAHWKEKEVTSFYKEDFQAKPKLLLRNSEPKNLSMAYFQMTKYAQDPRNL